MNYHAFIAIPYVLFPAKSKTNFVIEETELPEEEPFVINALQRYLLNQWLLKSLNRRDINRSTL